MKIFNWNTKRNINASLVFNTKDVKGQQWAVYHANNGYKVIRIPIYGDYAEIGITFKDTYKLNHNGALLWIDRKVLK